MDIMAGLSGLSVALESAKQLRAAYDKLSDLKEDIKSVEGQRLMLNLDKQILALENDLHTLDRENHDLKMQIHQIQENEDLEFDEHFGTTTRVLENQKKEHFCTSCYAQKMLLVQMPLRYYSSSPGYICPACGKGYIP